MGYEQLHFEQHSFKETYNFSHRWDKSLLGETINIKYLEVGNFDNQVTERGKTWRFIRFAERNSFFSECATTTQKTACQKQDKNI